MSGPIKDGGPAFPLGSSEHVDGVHYADAGMPLRDYFAAKAMQSLISKPIEVKMTWESEKKIYAIEAYEIADAMLAAREVQP